MRIAALVLVLCGCVADGADAIGVHLVRHAEDCCLYLPDTDAANACYERFAPLGCSYLHCHGTGWASDVVCKSLPPDANQGDAP